MKPTPNLTFVIAAPTAENPKATETTSVAKILAACLQSPPQGGLDFATIRARLRVSAVLDKAVDGGVIELEDADHAAAVEAIKLTRWLRPEAHLLQFAELFGL